MLSASRNCDSVIIFFLKRISPVFSPFSVLILWASSSSSLEILKLSQKELDAFKKTIEEAFNDPEFLKQNTIPLTEEEFKDLIKEKTILRH